MAALPRGAMRLSAVVIVIFPDHTRLLVLQIVMYIALIRLFHIPCLVCNLTLNAPITTKVVCFSRLLKCLRSLYSK